jgi:hypothetical protein
MLVVRINGPAPTYQGGLYPSDYRTGGPVHERPAADTRPIRPNQGPGWHTIHDHPDGFIATPDMLGESTPQGRAV